MVQFAFFKNGEIHGDVLHTNGKRAYKGIFLKAFNENGNKLGNLNDGSFSSDGVEMNLGDECDLSVGTCVHIQIGRRGKSFQLSTLGFIITTVIPRPVSHGILLVYQ
jgi:hypothetical protein